MSEAQYRILGGLILPPISGSRPSGGVNVDTEGVPSLGGENILTSGGVTYDVIKRIPLRFYQYMPKGRLAALDVLINKDGAQTGKVGLYEGMFEEAAVNEHLFILRPRDREILDPVFLFYAMLLDQTRAKIERRITGSAQPGLNSQFVKAVDIPFFEVTPQRKIARILQTVDRAMEKTEALIEKYQQIKAGLMHDLFTRGLWTQEELDRGDHRGLPTEASAKVGQLRPTRQDAPHLYQQTPIGWIPKAWKAESLKSILKESGGYLQTGPFGSQLHAHEYTSEGVPVVMPQDINDGTIDAESIARIPEKRAQLLARHRLKRSDIIIARRGELSRAADITVSDIGSVCGTGCFLLRLGGSKLDARFFAHSYRHYMIQTQVAGLAVGTTMPSLNNEIMGKLVFPHLGLLEQNQISDRIDLVEKRLRWLSLELKKHRVKKSGLMHDLLTGKVPVTPDA